MHYFTFDLGDYAKDTEHLTALEHGIYTMLMRWYYANEKPIPDGMPTRITREGPEVVNRVLDEFFDYDEAAQVYHHKRIEDEIDKVHAKSNKARESAAARWGNRNADAQPTKRGRTATSRPQDLKDSPKPPEGAAPRRKREGKPMTEMATFIESLDGGRAFEPSDPIFEYARKSKLPVVMVKLAWLVFVDKMIAKHKRQKDWRQAFRNYVESNYLKLWYVDDTDDEINYALTTAGKQAKEKYRERL